jgi:hypothetical protein
VRGIDATAHGLRTRQRRHASDRFTEGNTMQTRKIGNSGLEVSTLGLGCMGMSSGLGPPGDRA